MVLSKMVQAMLGKWFLEYYLSQVYFCLTHVLSGAEETAKETTSSPSEEKNTLLGHRTKR